MIKIENVNFSYSGSQGQLKNINVHIKKGNAFCSVVEVVVEKQHCYG